MSQLDPSETETQAHLRSSKMCFTTIEMLRDGDMKICWSSTVSGVNVHSLTGVRTVVRYIVSTPQTTQGGSNMGKGGGANEAYKKVTARDRLYERR